MTLLVYLMMGVHHRFNDACKDPAESQSRYREIWRMHADSFMILKAFWVSGVRQKDYQQCNTLQNMFILQAATVRQGLQLSHLRFSYWDEKCFHRIPWLQLEGRATFPILASSFAFFLRNKKNPILFRPSTHHSTRRTSQASSPGLPRNRPPRPAGATATVARWHPPGPA